MSIQNRVEKFIRLLEKRKDLRIKYKIGEGSSREAYQFGDMIPYNYFGDKRNISNADCIKKSGHAVFYLGILQSLKEIEVWGKRKLFRETTFSYHAFSRFNRWFTLYSNGKSASCMLF